MRSDIGSVTVATRIGAVDIVLDPRHIPETDSDFRIVFYSREQMLAKTGFIDEVITKKDHLRRTHMDYFVSIGVAEKLKGDK
jgi:hypothetical protein